MNRLWNDLFSGHQWFLLPTYFHPSVPAFFRPSRVLAPPLPQIPVVAESEESASSTGPEGEVHLK